MVKKVIVTGANGFLGSYLIDELLRQDYDILAVIRDKQADISKVERVVSKIVFCDLSNMIHLDTLIPTGDYDAFYHLAWAGSSGNARKDYSLQLQNAKFCVDAAFVAARLGCKRFVGVGSVAELVHEKYNRKDFSRPESVACYAVGKMAAEYMAHCVCIEQEIDFLWGHVANFYGIGDRSENIVNYLIQSYIENRVPELTDGEQRADFLYVSDVAKALALMGKKGKAGCSYYIGYGSPIPLKDFVIKIRNLINPELESGLGRREFHGLDIDYGEIDMHKLHRHTGFVPKVAFDEGIKMTIEWIQNLK